MAVLRFFANRSSPIYVERSSAFGEMRSHCSMEFHPRKREHAGRAKRIQKQNASKCFGLDWFMFQVPGCPPPPPPPAPGVVPPKTQHRIVVVLVLVLAISTRSLFYKRLNTSSKPMFFRFVHCFLYNVFSDFHLKLPLQRATKSLCCWKCFS